MKRAGIMLLLMLLSGTVCGSSSVVNEYISAAEQFISAMSLEEKIGQMLMPAVPGREMNPEIERIISTFHPGGVIFFGFNLGEPEENAALAAGIQACSMKYSGLPVLISVDQEGGRVKRIRSGVTQFPGNMAAGAAGDPDLTYRMAKTTGLQLRALGINMNLTPVLDVNDNPENPVINTRSFGADVNTVSVMGCAYIRGLQDGRCISSGKHFPGLGNSGTDNHLRLAVISGTMERLEQVELEPFRQAAAAGAECIMTTHVAFPNILKNNDSATVSPFFTTEVLRNRLGFKGVIITDDMEMGGLTKEFDIGTAAVRTVQAGSDIVLLSTYGKSIEKIYSSLVNAVRNGEISMERIDASVSRILALKIKYGVAEISGGSAEYREFRLSEEEKRFLAQAGELNREISSKAVSFRGDENLFKSRPDAVKIYVSSDPRFTEHLLLNEQDMVLAGKKELAAALKKIPEGKEIIITGQAGAVKSDFCTQLKKACGSRKVLVAAAVSGNPFPLLVSGNYDGIIMSFSDTDVSMEYLAKACSGQYMAKQERKLLPGR